MKKTQPDKYPMQRVAIQRNYVNHLKHDNEMLKLQLTQESRDAKRATKLGGSTEIIRLQHEADDYLIRIAQEKKRMEELDSTMNEVNSKIMAQKTKLGGVAASQTNNRLIERQINLLETRLDQYLVKFNESLAENRRLRNDIDGHRKQRVMYDLIYKKLERELHERKKQMMVIIHDSQAAYQARDKAKEELKILQEQCTKEKKEFEGEFKELGRIIQEERLMVEQMRLNQLNTLGDGPDPTSGIESTQEEREEIQEGWDTKEKGPLINLSEERLETFEEALHKIQVKRKEDKRL